MISLLKSEKLPSFRTAGFDLTEYFTALCDEIASKEPQIQALVPGTFDRDAILKQAEELQNRYADTASRPSLFGLPIGVKDIFRVDGFLTRCGSNLPPALFEGAEAEAVTRLRNAGAIVIGKTVTAEFAGPEPGPTRNPHNLSHTPGGSSSGSAAGVAAGYFAVALGTQTLGSITRPAAYCGVIGVKPSFGRIPIDGVVLFSGSADHVGVFFSDVNLMPMVLSQLIDDWRNPEQSSHRNTVFAIPEGPYLAQATRRALTQFESCVARMQQAGYQIKRIPALDDINAINDAHRRLITWEVARIHSDWFREYAELYRPRTAEYMQKGREITDDQLQGLRDRRLRLRDNMVSLMHHEGIDAWICPSATDHAPQGLDSTGDPVMNIPWTNSGLPTISLPVGLDDAELPHGLQLVGSFNQDEALVALAIELSTVLGNNSREET
jgi:Asp-tRNA(Asn)/Glu-tRNA(Gln) amidotransferase A subunit family amidase